jgi:hypothetical protein
MVEPGGRDTGGRVPREKAAQLRRYHGARPTWSALFAVLALLGLLIIPIDYRGGDAHPHAHSLLQLVLDASDGILLHDHADPRPAFSGSEHRSWFEPDTAVTSSERGTSEGATHGVVDSYSGIPFLLAALVTVTFAVGFGIERSSDSHRLRGRIPEILCPPPQAAIAV